MARILIADDNAEIRQLLTAILSDEGHKVVVADDGKKALEMILAHAPDILVLDIMMPSIDGYGVLKEMKSAGMRDAVKVLVLTAKTQESDWVRGFKLGADQYLTKPFDVDEFTQAIDGLIAMTKEQLRLRRQEELDRAQLLSRLESIFDH
ncbi:MAG: response regulator transcription factor [Actinomycetota bacterium]